MIKPLCRVVMIVALAAAAPGITAQSGDAPGGAEERGRQPAPPGNDAPAPDVTPAPDDDIPRQPAPPRGDPTQPSGRLRDLLNPAAAPDRGAAPTYQRSYMPDVRLKARVLVRGRPPVAVLEVNGALYTVREGLEFDVPADAGGSFTLRVDSIDAQAVQLHLESLDKKLTLQ